ncbi:MAG: hypothetical protein VKL42_18675 [Snowella sp.]|nr:hypothetical protein [Snowella sp.]
MNHFSPKSLAFYGTMIGSVLVLFNIVSAYGEANLKAPPKVSGNYQLTSSDLPDCLISENLTLAIEQSGRYIAGELSLSSQTIATPEKVSPVVESSSEKPGTTEEKQETKENIILSGLMLSQPFTLSGKTALLGSCSVAASPKEIDLQLQFQDKNLSGQLHWSDLVINFTAQKLEPTNGVTK